MAQAPTSAEAGIPSPWPHQNHLSSGQDFPPHILHQLRESELQVVGSLLLAWIIPRSSLALSRFLKCLETKNSNIFLSRTPVNIFLKQISRIKKQNDSYFHPSPFRLVYLTKTKRKFLNQTLLKWRDNTVSCFTKRTYVTKLCLLLRHTHAFFREPAFCSMIIRKRWLGGRVIWDVGVSFLPMGPMTFRQGHPSLGPVPPLW